MLTNPGDEASEIDEIIMSNSLYEETKTGTAPRDIHGVTIEDDTIVIYENYEEIHSEGVQTQTAD